MRGGEFQSPPGGSSPCVKKTFRSSEVLRAVTMVMGHVDHNAGSC